MNSPGLAAGSQRRPGESENASVACGGEPPRCRATPPAQPSERRGRRPLPRSPRRTHSRSPHEFPRAPLPFLDTMESISADQRASEVIRSAAGVTREGQEEGREGGPEKRLMRGNSVNFGLLWGLCPDTRRPARPRSLYRMRIQSCERLQRQARVLWQTACQGDWIYRIAAGKEAILRSDGRHARSTAQRRRAIRCSHASRRRRASGSPNEPVSTTRSSSVSILLVNQRRKSRP